jgi:3-oxoacyl-[acyl-carrier-protein] synthase II
MPRRRVVITGLGPVTPIGVGAEGLWDGLRRERSVVRTITRFDPALWRSRNAGEVADFDGADYLEAKRLKRLDRFGQFTVVAAQLALADAGLTLEAEDRDRVGAMMGTALGGVGFAEGELTKYVTEGVRAVDADARAQRLRRRGELQPGHRVRRARPQLDQRDELRLGRHGARRRLPRRSATATPT